MTMLPPDPVYIFKGDMLSISCISFKITEIFQRIYAGTQSGNVHVWNLKSKRETATFKAGDDSCLSICIPQNEDIVITHTKCGDISFWNEDGDKWVLKKLIKIDFFGFCKCQIFDNALYVPIKDAKCELISVNTMDKLDTVNLRSKSSGDLMAFKVCIINSRKMALVAYEGFELGLWDLSDSNKLSSLRLEECPMAVDYNVATNKGFCGSAGDEIIVFSVDKNLEFKKERNIILTNPGVAAVRIRPDGKLVAVGCWDGRLRLYSAKSLVLLAVLDVHSSTVQDVSFSENYRESLKMKYLLAAGSQDSRISLWDLYN